MKIAYAAILALSASTFPALASNGGCEFPEATASVVYLGDPCDLIEPEVVEAEEIAKADPNGALINAEGMPTSMPVVMRPSMDGEAVPAEAAPAAAAPSDTAKPQGGETKPAPVAEADKPKEPEQQASAPAPAVETPLPPVQKQEGEELN